MAIYLAADGITKGGWVDHARHVSNEYIDGGHMVPIVGNMLVSCTIQHSSFEAVHMSLMKLLAQAGTK